MRVWIWTASLVCDDAKIAEVLSEDERWRAQRYAFRRDRVRFIAARSFLRRTLGRHRGVDPASLRFAYGLCGRPELEDAPTLQFNLSYSSDQALLAVSRNGPLGVDLEARRPLPDLEGLALQVMDPVEQRAFRRSVGARPISSVLCALELGRRRLLRRWEWLVHRSPVPPRWHRR